MNAATLFNKIYQSNQHIPKYINITTKGNINKVLIPKEWPQLEGFSQEL
jgi:hypothetical protein